MSKEWSVADLRANFEWGGQARLDPAIFDRAIAKIKADTIRDAADAAFSDKRIRGLQRTIIGVWLRARADKLDPS